MCIRPRAPRAGEALIESHLIGWNRAVGARSRPAQIDIPRRVGRQAVVFAGAFLETGPAERCADDGVLVEGRPRHADARQEIRDAVVLVVERAAVAVLPASSTAPVISWKLVMRLPTS